MASWSTTVDWLALSLAGRPYPDAPLHYWVAAVNCSHLFSWLLPLHEAARLASGMPARCWRWHFILLLAARQLHGREQAPAAPTFAGRQYRLPVSRARGAADAGRADRTHRRLLGTKTLLERRPLRGACCFWFGTGARLPCQRSGANAPAACRWPPLSSGAPKIASDPLAAARLVRCSLPALVAGAWLAALLRRDHPHYLTSISGRTRVDPSSVATTRHKRDSALLALR
jgi:hypothetical protein